MWIPYTRSMCLLLCSMACSVSLSYAAESPPIPTAILPFESRGDVEEQTVQVVDLLFANLITSENVSLVERQAIESVFNELKLSKTGAVKADEVVNVGNLTGAKLLITGSVLQVNGDLHLIAKIIGTETSRLSGVSVKGPLNADLSELVTELAAEIDKTVASKAATLLPESIPTVDWIAAHSKQLKGKTLPSVTVSIKEVHVGQETFDPAAQNECERLLTELGFKVIAADSANAARADIAIKGEAISQTASSRADFVSVKCRTEVTVTQQSDGTVLTSDSETTISVDLAEQIAGKTGLQESARILIDRILPKLTK